MRYYEIKEDKLVRLKRSCPKCGAGTWLGEHDERYTCGKCGYTEWKERKK